MGDNPHFTPEQIIDALDRAGGRLSGAAQLLCCNYSTVAGYISKHPVIAEAKKAIDESYLDMAEDKLITKVKEGNLGAICFFLKCIGKQRGYVERQEHAGVPDQPIHISIVPAKAPDGTED